MYVILSYRLLLDFRCFLFLLCDPGQPAVTNLYHIYINYMHLLKVVCTKKRKKPQEGKNSPSKQKTPTCSSAD